jgi:hypothetical protein
MRLAHHTLVVSLRADVERREKWSASANSIGLEDWQYFDAFDASSMQLRAATPTTHGRAARRSPDPLLPGETGCALSHLAIWRAAHALHLTELCVLEDDITFLDPAGFERAWYTFMSELPRDWAALQLNGDPVCGEPRDQPVSDQVARVHAAYGTRALVLRADAIGMLATSTEGDLLRKPADWMLWPLYATGKVYAPRRSMLRHHPMPGGIRDLGGHLAHP